MLAILGRLHHVNTDMLGWWLCERQLPSGGLNGKYTFVGCKIIVTTYQLKRRYHSFALSPQHVQLKTALIASF